MRAQTSRGGGCKRIYSRGLLHLPIDASGHLGVQSIQPEVTCSEVEVTCISSGLGDTRDGIIFPGRCQSTGKKEEERVSRLVQGWSIDLASWGEAVYLDVHCFSSSRI